MLEQIFGWVPLEVALDREVLQVLYAYIGLHSPLSLAALTCVNELLGRQLVPAQHAPVLADMFQHIFALLSMLTARPDAPPDPLYVDKLTQFISLFVSNHLRRVEAAGSLPVLDLLALLFRYTFMQTRMSGFVECLDIWACLLEHLAEDARAAPPAAAAAARLQRYEEGLCALVAQIMQRVQFRTNAAQLQQLNSYTDVGARRPGADETDEDDSDAEADDAAERQSEFETFLTRSIEIVARVAELYPARVLSSLVCIFVFVFISFKNKTLTRTHWA